MSTNLRRPRVGYAIDFDQPLDDLSLPVEARVSPWGRKLGEVIEAVRLGDAKVGLWYKVGEFGNASGARSVVRGFENHPERLPEGEIEVQTRVLTRGGKRVSELYARVPVAD